MKQVPDEFQDFVQEKQLQLRDNVVTSNLAGIVLANLASIKSEGPSLSILVDTLIGQLVVLALTAVAIYFAKEETFTTVQKFLGGEDKNLE